MGKKGVSAEEKRKRILEIFYETKDFFLLKELEKIAPKQKGVIAQSVKDVLQSLVDDNMVDTDKIGTSVYFWAFPSKALATRQTRISTLREKVDAAVAKNKDLDLKIKESTTGKEESDDRTAILEELADLEKKKETLKAKIKKYEGCDPEELERLKKETTVAKEAVNRWTDNIYSIQSWVGKKYPSVNVNDLNQQFGVPDDMDYIE